MTNELVAGVLWVYSVAFGVAALLAYLTIGDLEHDQKATTIHRLLPLLAAGCVVYAVSLVSQGLWVRSGGAPSDYRLIAWLLVQTADQAQLLATGALTACIMGSVLFIRSAVHAARGRNGETPQG